jgi:hypothetical protein
MKKSILNLRGAQVLSKEDQKIINGAGGCCNPGSPFSVAFPRICQMFPPCQVQ